VLRSEESYSQKWNYVRENPVRVSLAKTRMIGLTLVRLWPFITADSYNRFALRASAAQRHQDTLALRRPEGDGYSDYLISRMASG
jgi:hypothetical protein